MAARFGKSSYGATVLVKRPSNTPWGPHLQDALKTTSTTDISKREKKKEMSCGRLNASWKISSSAVDGQSFLVIDGSLLNLNKKRPREPSSVPRMMTSSPARWVLVYKRRFWMTAVFVSHTKERERKVAYDGCSEPSLDSPSSRPCTHLLKRQKTEKVSVDGRSWTGQRSSLSFSWTSGPASAHSLLFQEVAEAEWCPQEEMKERRFRWQLQIHFHSNLLSSFMRSGNNFLFFLCWIFSWALLLKNERS